MKKIVENNGWFDAEELCPPFGEKVLCHIRGNIYIGKAIAIDEYGIQWESEWGSSDADYWMPLPNTPELS